MDVSFGTLLKDWRGRRRFSQLDLALTANVSARHIAFLETGRTKPSRTMVIQLSDALTIPRAERNAMLNSAGFASTYRRRNMDDQDMAYVRSAVSWTLERHDPYPAMAVDRHWRLVQANRSASALLSSVRISPGDSMLEAAVSSALFRDAIVNWPDVARHMHQRLRTESAHLGGDPVLDAAAEKLAQHVNSEAGWDDALLPAVVPTVYRAGDATLSFFSTIAQFGSAEDIALADLKIELLFPADDLTREMLFAQAASNVGRGSSYS